MFHYALIDDESYIPIKWYSCTLQCSNKMNEIIYRIHLYLLNAFGPNQNSSFILSLWTTTIRWKQKCFQQKQRIHKTNRQTNKSNEFFFLQNYLESNQFFDLYFLEIGMGMK